jgi:hypothetical protein
MVGLAAAFALASISALPLTLGASGLSTHWIDRIGAVAALHRTVLLWVGGVGLAGGALMLWLEQQAAHASGDRYLETPAELRAITFAGLALGAVLLLAGANCI